jgi:CspA family cold shock protein
MAQRLMKLKMKGVGHTIQLLADTSLHIEDFLVSHGLLPRDGGLRYALDENDHVVSNRRLSEVPDTLFLGLPEQVLSVWVEKITKQGVQTKTVLENGDELYVPGLKPDEHYHVFVSRKSKSQHGVVRQHGYRFRTDGDAYLNGDHVYIKIPYEGDSVKIFDPVTGMETRELRVGSGNTSIEDIRGLWCVCTYQPGVNGKEWLLYRPELTFVPPGFKPRPAKKKQNPAKKKQNPAKKKQNHSSMKFGIVKWFDWNKGFGFIIQEDGSEVYFNKSNTRGWMKSGIKVKFNRRDSEKGPYAIKVYKVKK